MKTFVEKVIDLVAPITPNPLDVKLAHDARVARQHEHTNWVNESDLELNYE